MKNKTRKNNKSMKGAGVFNFFKSTFTPDSKYCVLNNGQIACSLCNNTVFLMRNGTIGKSKLGNIATDVVFGEDANLVMDISITCYFCSNCGNTIVIRDAKQAGQVYQHMVMPTLTDMQGKPIMQAVPVAQGAPVAQPEPIAQKK
jgi:predicted RNA-binding Zn-ribbon protein involved in translation (DUF1610 family)